MIKVSSSSAENNKTNFLQCKQVQEYEEIYNTIDRHQ